MTLPPGSNSSNLIQLLQWIANPLDYMETCANRYGDIFTARLGKFFSPAVFISNPQAIQKIFTADSKLFDSGRGNDIAKPLLGDTSIVLMDGDIHQRQRKLLMPPFHGERMRDYGDLIVTLTQQVSRKWTLGQPFIVRNSMQEITLRVILQAVFGLNQGWRYEQLQQKLAKMLDMTSSPLRSSLLFFKFLQKDLGSMSPWGRFVRQQQQINQLLYQEIAERRQQADLERTDILTLLMSAHDEQGQGMSDEELRDELITLLIAGHETTATTLSWAFYWIHHLPNVQQKLVQELETLGPSPEPTEIVRLPYLSAVCQETLRIYPVLFLTFPRILNAPWEIMDYQLESNTILAPCIYILHHREDLYPEPKQFKPERFLERQFSAYEYMPFGGGSRRCIGAALAEFEMKLVLATILKQYQLELTDIRPVKPQRRGLTLGPAGGVKMVMTGVRQPQEKPLVSV